MNASDINDAMIYQGLFKLMLAFVGILMGRGSLIFMDYFAPQGFKNWISKADDRAKAIYYSGRLIFVGLIIGAAVS